MSKVPDCAVGLPIALIEVGTDGSIRGWNEAAERLLGVHESTRTLSELGLPEDPVGDGEVSLRRKNGSTFAAWVQAGEGWIAVVDLSELKAKEASIRAAEQIEGLRRMAGGIAHDLNNLLAGILAEIFLAQRRLPPGDPLGGVLAKVKTALDRTALLARNLTSVAGRRRHEICVVDLSSMVRGMDLLLRSIAGDRVAVTTIPSPSLGAVRIDARLVEEVLVQLAVQAREAMPAGGEIEIHFEDIDGGAPLPEGLRPGRYVLLVVRGCGSKLELGPVRNILQRHGGTVRVERSGDAHIWLPRHEPADSTPMAASASAPGSGTVLVVEDDEILRSTLVSILEENGYATIAACNGAEALQEIGQKDRPIDMVIADVTLPDSSGPELAERVRRDRGATRTLFVSGYPRHVLQERGLPPDAELLEKPFQAHELLARVGAMLARGSR